MQNQLLGAYVSKLRHTTSCKNYALGSTRILYYKCWITCLFSILPMNSPFYLMNFSINLKCMHNSL